MVNFSDNNKNQKLLVGKYPVITKYTYYLIMIYYGSLIPTTRYILLDIISFIYDTSNLKTAFLLTRNKIYLTLNLIKNSF